MIHSQTPALSTDEKVILDIITKNHGWILTDGRQQRAGMALQRVYGAFLRCRSGTFDNPSGGLLAKIKNLEMDYHPDTRKYSFRIP